MGGAPLDIYRLYLCVKVKGGAEAVSENEQWSVVARELGLKKQDHPLKIAQHYAK